MAIISRVGWKGSLQMKFRNETFISSNGKLKAHTPLSLCIEFPPCRLQRDSFLFLHLLPSLVSSIDKNFHLSIQRNSIYWYKIERYERTFFYEWICFSQSAFSKFDSSQAIQINFRMIWPQVTLKNMFPFCGSQVCVGWDEIQYAFVLVVKST